MFITPPTAFAAALEAMTGDGELVAGMRWLYVRVFLGDLR